MFADSRFDYLSRVRYYTAMVVTPVHFLAELPGLAVDGVASLFQSRRQLVIENEQLQEQLLMQQYQLQKLEHLAAENSRLNELLKASSVVDEVVMRTQLVGESPDPFVKRILINKGSSEGVYIGQPVLDASGLMGQVMEVEPLTSWVLLITDPQHATPVQVNRNGLRAIAAGTRDSLHFLTLNNIPNTADIEAGDVLVTSGLGDRFPAGYPVGVVDSVVRDPGKPFADVLVRPTAQIDRSRNLLLVFESRASTAPAGAMQPAIPQPVLPELSGVEPVPAPALELNVALESVEGEGAVEVETVVEPLEAEAVIPASVLDLEGPPLPEPAAAPDAAEASAGGGQN